MNEFYKSILTSIFFYIVLITATSSLVIVILWGSTDKQTGMGSETYRWVFFSMAAPASNVSLWGVILSLLLLQARPSEIMMITYYVIGLVFHLTVFIMQLMVVMKEKHDDVTIFTLLSAICAVGNLVGLAIELVDEFKAVSEGAA